MERDGSSLLKKKSEINSKNLFLSHFLPTFHSSLTTITIKYINTKLVELKKSYMHADGDSLKNKERNLKQTGLFFRKILQM